MSCLYWWKLLHMVYKAFYFSWQQMWNMSINLLFSSLHFVMFSWEIEDIGAFSFVACNLHMEIYSDLITSKLVWPFYTTSLVLIGFCFSRTSSSHVYLLFSSKIFVDKNYWPTISTLIYWAKNSFKAKCNRSWNDK